MKTNRMSRGSAWIVCTALLIGGASHATKNDPLTKLEVTIKLGKTPYSVSSRIRNVSKKRVVFWSWYCSYEKEWKTDNEQIRMKGTACDKNDLFIQYLEPGEFRDRELALTVDPNINENGLFRVAFVPEQSPKRVERANGSLAVLKDPSRRITSTLNGYFWSNGLMIGSLKK